MSGKVKGEIVIVDFDTKTPLGKHYGFRLVQDGKDPIPIWEQTANDKDSPEMVMLKNAFQKVYDQGFRDGKQK